MLRKPKDFFFRGRIVRVLVVGVDLVFSSTDLCDILGYVNPHKILSRCCDSPPRYFRVLTAGGPQNLRMIGLGDVRNLLLNYSRKPVAQELWDWIGNELIPKMAAEHAEFILETIKALAPSEVVILIPLVNPQEE